MKIGPWEIRLFRSDDPNLPFKPEQSERKGRGPIGGEIGATGTQIFGGLLTQNDYNSTLVTPNLYDIYDKMRLADGQVRAALSVIKLPLLSTEWYIEPASDDPLDVEIAEAIEDDLMNNMTITWQSFLRQALLHLDYGSMLFEPVWEVRDGLVHLRKLAPRLPKSIIYWYVDEHGGFNGVRQGAILGSGYQQVDIPPEKCLLFVNDQEGANLRGVSILRAAYKHWFFKDNLYRVQAIALEKRSMGVDVGTLKGNEHNDQTRRDLEAALMRLHAHEKQFFTEIEDEFTYRIEGIGAGRMADPQTAIDHHDTAILRSVLAEFLAMGTGSTGSLAMHRDKTAFFIMALKAVAQYICDTMNRYLIKRWVDYNWKVEKYPKLRHGRLERREVELLADAVDKFVKAGVLHPQPDDENEIREVLELPPLPEQPVVPPMLPGAGLDDPVPELGPLPTDTSGNPIPQGEQRPEGPGGLAQLAQKQQRRQLTDAEKHVDFAGIEHSLNAARDRIVATVKETQDRQIARLVEEAATVVRRDEAAGVQLVEVPFKREVATATVAVLRDLFRRGREQVRDELQQQAKAVTLVGTALPLDPHEEPDIEAFLELRSENLADLMGDRLRSAFVWELLAQIRRGVFDGPALKAVLADLADTQLKLTADNIVSEALNLGREMEARRQAERIDRAQYSSVLDSGTCGPCRQQDGKTFVYGSEAYARARPPYRLCEGRGRCRCVMVFVLKGERGTVTA